MSLRHILFGAIIAAAIPAAAFADDCKIGDTRDQQVGELKITVHNKSSAQLKVQFSGSNPNQRRPRTVKKRSSKSRTYSIPKDDTSSKSKVKKLGFGVSVISMGDFPRTIGQTVVKAGVRVTNSYWVESDNTEHRTTRFGTASLEYALVEDDYIAECSIKFKGAGKNSWEYKITVKDK